MEANTQLTQLSICSAGFVCNWEPSISLINNYDVLGDAVYHWFKKLITSHGYDTAVATVIFTPSFS